MSFKSDSWWCTRTYDTDYKPGEVVWSSAPIWRGQTKIIKKVNPLDPDHECFVIANRISTDISSPPTVHPFWLCRTYEEYILIQLGIEADHLAGAYYGNR